MNRPPILSIVTGTWDREASMKRFVDSLHATMQGVNFELVVSDASVRPYQGMAWPKNTKILPENPPAGCVKGFNRAFEECRGDYVVWMNDDCECMPQWATRALDFMESRPSVGVGMMYWRDPEEKKWHWNRAYWDIPYANFGILRRDFGNSIGWFDEDLRMYGCDTSLAYKSWLWRRGVVGILGSRVMHHRLQDDHRKRNQATQTADTDTLFAKYKPLAGRMLEVVNEFASIQPSPEILDTEWTGKVQEYDARRRAGETK